MHFGELGVLKRTFQLARHDIFEAVVGDDVVCCALVFDRNGLLHQSTFLEFVAVNQRAAEASLLIRSQILGKVCVDLSHRIRRCDVASSNTIKRGVFVFVFGGIHILSRLAHGWACKLLALPFATARRVQGGLFLFWFKSSDKLTVDEAVVHDTARRPMHGIGPSLDSRSVLLVDQDGARGEHLCTLLVVRPPADVAQPSL